MPTRDLCAGVAGALRIAAGQFDDFVESPGSVVLSLDSECPLTAGTTPFGVLSELRRLFALAGDAMAVAKPEWLPVELRGCCGDAGPASTLLGKAIVCTSWLSPGELDVYDIACGSARACRMAVDSIEAWGDAWGMDEPVATPEPLAETTLVQIDPPNVVSDEASSSLGYGEMQSVLEARLRAVCLEAMDAAVRDRRGSEAHGDGDAAVAEYRLLSGLQIARDLVEAGCVPEPADDRDWDRLRKQACRAAKALGWRREYMPDAATKAASTDFLSCGAAKGEAALQAKMPPGYRLCPSCEIGVASHREYHCDRCLDNPDLVGIVAKASPKNLEWVNEAREQALEEFVQGLRASQAKPSDEA